MSTLTQPTCSTHPRPPVTTAIKSLRTNDDSQRTMSRQTSMLTITTCLHILQMICLSHPKDTKRCTSRLVEQNVEVGAYQQPAQATVVPAVLDMCSTDVLNDVNEQVL